MIGMTRKFRDLWFTRCTDGSYTQTRHCLIDQENQKKRCCLGVAHAVGEELGLIPTDASVGDRGFLTKEHAAMFGIENQEPFAGANDGHNAPEGQFYPNEVLELIKNYPTID